jgi:hypothetical protein
MPVRSLNSSVFAWPDAQAVDQAVRAWAHRLSQRRPELVRLGYFGSYARGDWGVGSDLDLVIVAETAPQPFERRSADWDTTELPVPADVLVYTLQEWESLVAGSFFGRSAGREVVWVYQRPSR